MIRLRSAFNTIRRTRRSADTIPSSFSNASNTASSPCTPQTGFHSAPGASLEALSQQDGSAGYAAALKHGETGTGLNDYEAIFRILADVGFDGWISVEDGMNGLDELRRSVDFLKGKRAQYF